MKSELPSLHQDDITVEGRVAVWVGSFTDETVADDYMNLSRDFERDFGFRVADRRGPEVAVKPQQVPIRELVEGFSCWRQYADAVVAAADAAGIATASTMLVFHWVEFDPKRVSVNPSAPVNFLGNFDFEGFK
jgi:Immunity protein 22